MFSLPWEIDNHFGHIDRSSPARAAAAQLRLESKSYFRSGFKDPNLKAWLYEGLGSWTRQTVAVYLKRVVVKKC